jgi:hypothetical protein
MRLTLHILTVILVVSLGVTAAAGIVWATQTAPGAAGLFAVLVVAVCWFVAWRVWPWLRR